MRVREYRQADEAEWVRMRSALWPEIGGLEQAIADAREWLTRADAAVLVAESENGLCGFAEVGERAYADGCGTSPVAYLEAWYVDREHRRSGVGRLLVGAAVEWARERGLREFASDTLLENTDSHRAHEALGFDEVERAVRYRRTI